MLQTAVSGHARASRKGAFRARFLIVDGDRAEQGDWTLLKLRKEAARENFCVIAQRPRHEAVLYRLFRGNERKTPAASAIDARLSRHWPDYQKPATFQMLRSRYSLDDFRRLAESDEDIKILAIRIGLVAPMERRRSAR